MFVWVTFDRSGQRYQVANNLVKLFAPQWVPNAAGDGGGGVDVSAPDVFSEHGAFRGTAAQVLARQSAHLSIPMTKRVAENAPQTSFAYHQRSRSCIRRHSFY